MTEPAPSPARRGRLRKRWHAPAQLRFGTRLVDAAAACFWLLVLLTLGAEVVAGQSWYHVFGATIYNPLALADLGSLALFAVALAVSHLAVLGAAFAVLKRLFGRRWGSPLLGFNFLIAGLALWTLLLLVRRMAMTYAADTPDLATLRSLAGGHLLQGLGYVRGEALALALAASLATAAYLLLRLVLDFERAPPPRTRPASAVVVGGIAVLLLFVAARVPDVYDALERFTAPRFAYRVLDAATDFDRDGYGLFSSLPDPAPFDARRHPYALDIPDDGIDQDGLAGDFHYDAPPPAPPAPPIFRGHRRHVVLIVLESTRADAVGKVWRGVTVAPALNALAAAGTASGEAYSNQAHTAGSLKVLFGGDVEPLPGGGSIFSDFHGAGYRVGVFSGEAEDWGGTAAAAGMRGAADIYVDAATLHAPGSIPIAPGEDVLRAFDRSFGKAEAWARPNFLYFNFQAPHFPYQQPGTRQLLPGRPIAESEIRPGNRELVESAYWNAVANADRLVGALVARVKRLGVYDDTIVAVVGDHGEELFEEGHLGHGLMLNARTTRVPLILSRPAITLPRPVGLASVRTILLRAAGADVPSRSGGPVLQFLGTLDRPSMIGMAEAGGAMTTLSLRDGRIVSTAPAAAGRYASLSANSPLKTKGDRLATLWARARWEHVLALRARSGAASPP
ncbi:MAG TPA: sulfatase-like hydrolase/transferase [Allosphingosinicella sp.]|jgi:hypothetical protein